MAGLVVLRIVLPSLLLLSGLFGLPAAHADGDRRELAYDVRIEPALTLAGGALWISTELLKDQLAPAQCRWCDDNALDRGVRRGLRWSNIERADAVSNWMGFGVVPALAFSGVAAAALVDDRAAGVWSDLGIVLEATVIAANLNQLVKMSVGRERPFVHALPEDEKPQTSRPSDNNLSFYSGHTSPAFTLAVSASMVATLRGYRLAKVVWATSLPLAGLTGYLRIAADRHYFTDVMTGAALGSAIGLLVPWLHRRSPGSTAVTVSASSRQLLVEWRL